MNETELRAALDGDPVRKDIVLARVANRRSRRRAGRIIAASSAGAVGAAAVIIAVVVPGSGHSDRAATQAPPPPARGCGPLRPRLANAVANGQSVIEAFGRLTGQAVSKDATPYRQMALTGVRTLSGPAVPTATLGWI